MSSFSYARGRGGVEGEAGPGDRLFDPATFDSPLALGRPAVGWMGDPVDEAVRAEIGGAGKIAGDVVKELAFVEGPLSFLRPGLDLSRAPGRHPMGVERSCGQLQRKLGHHAALRLDDRAHRRVFESHRLPPALFDRLSLELLRHVALLPAV